jgi:hypothetical protein
VKGEKFSTGSVNLERSVQVFKSRSFLSGILCLSASVLKGSVSRI